MAPQKSTANKAQNSNNADEENESTEVDKHRRDKADLEKVTDFHEDKDEMNEVSKESLGNLENRSQSDVKNIVIRKEDIQLIVDELETTRAFAERFLLKHDGDVRGAIREIMGF